VVAYVAHNHGNDMDGGDIVKWSQKEMEILCMQYPIGGFDAVKNLINRSQNAIWKKAKKMNLHAPEDCFIKAGLKLHLIYPQIGADNPNWKGGISKDNMRYKKRTQIKYPEKAKAVNALNHAVSTEKIIRKPCEVCGDLKSEAHHNDYSKPFEVIWLCRKHHIEVHKEAAQCKIALFSVQRIK
jgi:hypothetical protein